MNTKVVTKRIPLKQGDFAIVNTLLCICLLVLFVFPANAQLNFDDTDTLMEKGVKIFKNKAMGEFTPGNGFQLVKNKVVSLNISLYGMARYVNQMPGDDKWLDHRDSLRVFDGRHDIHWHRSMIWFRGYLGTPKFTYAITIWSIMTTQQTLIFGTLAYKFNKYAQVGIGMTPNLCIRSMQGAFPFFTSTDRTMAEDALRGGFTNGVFVRGDLTPKLSYYVAVGNNLSTLGVKAANLTRRFSKSFSLDWRPTTGEFGPRGGNGDFERHETIATRFGVSYCHSREDRFNNIGQPSPDNTQVRLSDGLLFFEKSAMAPGVTISQATYDQVSVDLGFKIKGFALHTELYMRSLSKIDADGPIPYNKIIDYGFVIQPMYMVVPKIVCVYAVNSMLVDEFKRNPWEAGGGVNIYPLKSRSWRVNLQAMYVYKSAGGGTFGLYTSGQTGTTLTFGTDILL